MGRALDGGCAPLRAGGPGVVEVTPQVTSQVTRIGIIRLRPQGAGTPEVVVVAWMRMMGVDSVEYHRQTVLDRQDDHPGAAHAYYASRGETPLAWGGGGSPRLGLDGTVTPEQYEALFGPGGARDAATGKRLVSTKRPGLELVVSAHKSVAELGVIGRREHMHQILDAEREGTLAYLERLTQERGGRRGRAATPTPTSGLVFAFTRHATSRAGALCVRVS